MSNPINHSEGITNAIPVPTTVYYAILNGGDGSAYVEWFLTEEDADWVDVHQYEGWADQCIGSAQTYKGSNIHLEALVNSESMKQRKLEWNEYQDESGEVEDADC